MCLQRIQSLQLSAIKMTDITSGMTVGHLPMENSPIRKFLLDRGARVFALLTSKNFCVLLLFQGGLEIHVELKYICLQQ